MNESISHIVELALTGGLSGFFGWFIKRKTQQTEAQGNQIENADKALKYYQQMVDDLGKRLTEAIKELAEARKAIHELEQKVEGLTIELSKYKQLNGKKE